MVSALFTAHRSRVRLAQGWGRVSHTHSGDRHVDGVDQAQGDDGIEHEVLRRPSILGIKLTQK